MDCPTWLTEARRAASGFFNSFTDCGGNPKPVNPLPGNGRAGLLNPSSRQKAFNDYAMVCRALGLCAGAGVFVFRETFPFPPNQRRSPPPRT